ncbi:MAG: hypothetical protein DRG25_04195 [Deltaproteobacteria bacterium]|nr:MAG: hypothetical protein DRG25_04195 [Deltaproteobacteria bacterium]
MMDHISVSQINLYLDCSLKYKFYYIDRIPKPFKPSGILFGKAIHSALEWLNKQRQIGNHVNLEKLFKIFETDWFAYKAEEKVLFKEGETEEKLILKGKELLSLYFHQQNEPVLMAELPFQIPLISQTGEVLEVPLYGVIDLIEKGDVITEFKTSQKTMDLFQVSNSLQLTAYSYAYEFLFQKRPKGLKIVNLVKSKNPKLEVIYTTREKKDYQRLFLLAKKVLEAIKARIFFPKPSFKCKECEYQEYCQKWEG